jgi:hypothetical protein
MAFLAIRGIIDGIAGLLQRIAQLVPQARLILHNQDTHLPRYSVTWPGAPAPELSADPIMQ